MVQINTLLIANRGEIACRIIRTAKELGVRTVAVYSEADINALHVRLADDAHHIGPSPASESYLSIEKIIETAKFSGADAIHPGYGFLSENAAFAAAVLEAGIVFIGPSVHAIEVMGDKSRAKRAMLEANVPCVPGYQGDDQSNDALIKAASDIEYPLMVKASAGGGGRGMRLVNDKGDLLASLELARAEAISAFGTDHLILEKAINYARHVEIQVFGDVFGNIIHLGERDCSVQRRHQKIIEEAPCPVMSAELRAAMGEAAIKAARAVEYVGAGTVEFLLDEDGSFYFLEMNTRLQVEHAVTEMVTGLDLVKLQLLAAEGTKLPVTQTDIEFSGHAIEARIYAEDPSNDFLPSSGQVKLFNAPARQDIRVDSGIETDDPVTPFYDPMAAKIISHGANRNEARRNLIGALGKTALLGVKNNRDFLLDILHHPTFCEGKATTTFVSNGSFEREDTVLSDHHFVTAASLFYQKAQIDARRYAPDICDELLNWSSSGNLESLYTLDISDAQKTVRIISIAPAVYACLVGSEHYEVRIRSIATASVDIRINGRSESAVFAEASPNVLLISTRTLSYTARNVSVNDQISGDDIGSGTVKAPMHGKLISLNVVVGDKVSAGETLAILEAMKMQHELTARVDGTVSEILAQNGSNIAFDDVIAVIDPLK